LRGMSRASWLLLARSVGHGATMAIVLGAGVVANAFAKITMRVLAAMT
jgi:hypothetical protein